MVGKVAALLACVAMVPPVFAAAAPPCPVAAGTLLAASSRPILTRNLGQRAIVAGHGQERPGLIYEYGYSIRFEGAAKSIAVGLRGDELSMSDGCIFALEADAWREDGAPIFSRLRAVPRAEFGDDTPSFTPDRAPVVRGYAPLPNAFSNDGRDEHLGVWRAEGDRRESLIIAFTNDGHRVLARLPYRVTAMQTHLNGETGYIDVTLIADAPPSASIEYLVFGWDAGSAAPCCHR